MSASSIRLWLAGAFGLLGIMTGLAITMVGMLQGFEIVDIVALVGVLSTPVVSASIAFLLGDGNGVRRSQTKND